MAQYVWKNGVRYEIPDPTPEELAQMESNALAAQIENDSRPLTDGEILRLDMRQRVNSLVIDNATAGRMIEYFPTQSEVCAKGELIKAGTRIRDDKDASIIWRANADLWNTAENSPENAPTLWDKIAYHNGIRIIPDEITATQAWKLDELGWQDEHVYRSKMDGNVFPVTQEDAWDLVQ